MEININNNPKTRFTRMCIAEAITSMLKSCEFNKLKVSDIVKRAGVSRMTFYKYYDTPYAALTDYLNIIISEYIEQCSEEVTGSNYLEYSHIMYSLKFFDQYSDFFLTLANNNLHSIMLNGINMFMSEHIKTARPLSVYKMYSYAGGLLNSFLKWESDGKKDSIEEISTTIYQLYCGD